NPSCSFTLRGRKIIRKEFPFPSPLPVGWVDYYVGNTMAEFPFPSPLPVGSTFTLVIRWR
ncbi:hypothetical protein SK128_010129, partial [Halocaridina rubra]